MNIFKAIGYHGTDREISTVCDINFYHKQFQDHFLGRGFYLFRDSSKRALHWTNKQHDTNKSHSVVEVIIEVPEDEILNFSSSFWSLELEILELYIDVCRKYNIYFGSFIDFLIDELSIDIKAIAMIDLKTKNHFIPIKSISYSLFAYGDIQICVKNAEIIKNLKQLDIN